MCQISLFQDELIGHCSVLWLQSVIFVSVSEVFAAETERSKAVDVHLATHPLFSQLLFQWCQAAFLSQHAAVPPVDRRIHTEQLCVAVNPHMIKWGAQTSLGEQTSSTRDTTLVNRPQWRTRLFWSGPQVKEINHLCCAKMMRLVLVDRAQKDKGKKPNWYFNAHSH